MNLQHEVFSVLAGTSHSPTFSALEFLFFHILSLVLLMVAILISVLYISNKYKVKLIVIWICTFLMTVDVIFDVEHLFIYLLVNCMSSLEICLYNTLSFN